MSHAWRRWAGYVVASSYELSHEREYHAIRSSAALLDISPLYKYSVTGRAARLLDRVVLATSRARPSDKCSIPAGATPRQNDGRRDHLETRRRRFRMTSAEPNLRWLQDNAGGLAVKI